MQSPRKYLPGSEGTDDMLCPRCSSDMEQIETSIGTQNIGELRLCPSCYLVTWKDQNGSHSQQGIPVPKTLRSQIKKGEG